MPWTLDETEAPKLTMNFTEDPVTVKVVYDPSNNPPWTYHYKWLLGPGETQAEIVASLRAAFDAQSD